ncbi:MAG: GNAT family N-acetyltransferase [Anaerolineaceae bacterium]|nr:GNAT family N-acetyltransferase [Anaerolineaceae bacterium]
MVISDYDAVIGLWQTSAGVGLSQADSPAAIARYLARNPGLSQAAWTPGVEGASPVLAGAVLCGHDGRRGLLHHLAVRPEFRRQGLGRDLVACCLKGLAAEGIDKCHLFVFNENTEGQDFWLRCGWYTRPEIVLMSTDI